jgi:hypothetical protein
MFQSKMVTPAIPERVFTLCKIVERKPLSVAELKEKMEPDYLNQNTSYASDYRGAAEELKLISISDHTVSLAVSPSVIKTPATMRRYINGMLEEFKNGHFYQVTNAYFNISGNILSGEKNVAAMGAEIGQRINRFIDAMEMRAWRFWASFLGFGYLQEMFVIPNADVFLLDVIATAGFEKGYRYSFAEFINRILPYSRIVIDANPANRQLNFGVSNGLRTLHDLGIIKLEHILDQADIWNLYPMKAHVISATITNITICKQEART